MGTCGHRVFANVAWIFLTVLTKEMVQQRSDLWVERAIGMARKCNGIIATTDINQKK